jgi:UDP-N-acetyl-D-glucosamine dehydrogenase
MTTKFIELAGEINIGMPRYVMEKLEQALDRRQQVSLGSARVLILGLAYKKNVSDIRESPSFKLIELLEKRGTSVDFHDPLVDVIPPTRDHAGFTGRMSVALTAATLRNYNAVVAVTDHDAVDYRLVAGNARLIVDTRNVFARKSIESANLVKA